MGGTAKVAVRHQISFIHARGLMVEATIEYSLDRNAKLLSTHISVLGTRKIERFIRPAHFSITNPATPSPGAQVSKRPRLMNLNVSPTPMANTTRYNSMRNQGAHRGGARRGARTAHQGSRDTRPTFSTLNRSANEAFVFLPSARRPVTTPRATLTLAEESDEF
jgi:hypothetical protein